jgi:hypothetical protein
MVARLDHDKLTRLADGVAGLARRFDAMMARQDASVSPSEYKRLVKNRDEALETLTAYRERIASGERGLSLSHVEANYTKASNELAVAQVKMSKGWK